MPRSRRPAQPVRSRGLAPDDAAPGQGGQATADAFTQWCLQSLQPLGTRVRGVRAADGEEPGFDAGEFEQAELLTVQFADGSVLHTSPLDWADRHGADLAPARSTRSGGGDRVELPFDLPAAAPALRGDSGQLRVEQYQLARFTPPTMLDKVYAFGAMFDERLGRWFGDEQSPGASALAGRLCWAYENAALHPAVTQVPPSGRLLAWNGQGWEPVANQALAAAGEAVLLLHGTASSTEGSFGSLWEGDDRGRRPQDWQHRLMQPRADGQRPCVLAFEHRSLTASPLLNALDLADALSQAGLPAGARLRLLSHSRGGLVGEVLCLLLAPADDGIEGTLRAAYPPDHADHALIERFARLHARLGVPAAGWLVDTFVRVASPARGTLLADRRTDLFLSLLLRAIELGFGLTSAWYQRGAALVKGLVAARADARHLPGLEAMIPGSPLTCALNLMPESVRFGHRLRVIAGDAQAKGWGGLLTLVGDLFYGLHDHDFVVHTHAMFGGLASRDARSLRVEHPSVTHFGYFKAGSLTRQAVFAALDGQDAGFNDMALDEGRTRGLTELLTQELSRRPFDQWIRLLEQSPHSRPVLVVLPGIMGSELSTAEAGQRLVWLSTRALLLGDLKSLGINGPALRASGMMAVAYERLLKAASDKFHVVPLPFDWRRPIGELGAELRTAIDKLRALAQRQNPPQPVHVIAHSMGGLVARLALDPGNEESSAWRAFRDAGGRLLMLGTPNAGSYAPAQLLLRQHPVTNLVALAAVGTRARDLAEMGARYPGLMAMLPQAHDPLYGDLFQPTAWARARQDDDTLVAPDPATLHAASLLKTELATSFARLKDCDRVLYVAGQAPTPRHFRLVQGLLGSALRFGLTDEGDGTVTWESRLNDERTWYVCAGHGDLADLPDAFEAYFELLRTGGTQRLSQTRPATRSATDLGAALFPLPALPALPPDAAAVALGVTVRPQGRLAWVPPIEVRVVHGSLDYARYPLLVGHYANDGVYGAVQRVNEKLDGLLQRMVDLELISGKAGTATYLRPRSDDGRPPAYPGAIVVGLGSVGELTPAGLTDAVTRGVLRFAVEHHNQDGWASQGGTLLLRFSALLIGTHVQSMSKRDSMAAVLLGVWRAGQLLASNRSLGDVAARVVEVEIIEIEEPVALDAAYALGKLLDRPEWQSRYHWARRVLESRDGGLRGFKPSGSESLWQRLVVREDALGGLRYELLAERARVESTQVYADVASLKDYIARLSDDGAQGGRRLDEEAAIGHVLFQLLLPQALKARLSNFDRTVLVVDEHTAALPWELLTPPQKGPTEVEGTQPLAVQSGMVRQRITPEFRAAPPPSPGWTALVIGEPSTEGWIDADGKALAFAPLPGARKEAGIVRDSLRADARPWQVELLPPPATFEQVRTALLRRPWRVLHLAGHGVVDHWVRTLDIDAKGQVRRELRRTGMLLSHQQVLTAGDVEQMDPAPEFVFINCCYSAREGRSTSTERAQSMLAASLALQFIRMGSRAVVAAGWRVHDDDGLQFAEGLYRGLLEGKPFGAAVHEARKAVHALGRSNTWGAYQCYGDPDWRLVDDDRDSTNDTRGRGSSRLRDAHGCMSAGELAERIQQAVQIAGDKPTVDLVQQLQELEARVRDDKDRRAWLDDSRVMTAFGGAYRELARHEQAWSWYRRATLATGSHIELRQIELAIRSLTRLPEADRQRAHRLLYLLAEMDRAVSDDSAAAPPEPRASVARASIEGSRLLREAMLPWVESPTAAHPADLGPRLLEAAGHYGRAYGASSQAGEASGRCAYTLANAMLLAAMAVLADPDQARGLPASAGLALPVPEGGDAWSALEPVSRALLDDLTRDDRAGEFWDYTNAYELRLARCALKLGERRTVDADDLTPLVGLMRTALVRWPAPVELQSLRFNLECLQRVLKIARTTLGEMAAIADLSSQLTQVQQLLDAHRVGGGDIR